MKKLLTIMLLLLTGITWAGDFEDGFAAFDKENYTVAMEKFKLAAVQGNVQAVFWIGLMYKSGYGVVKDVEEAAKWYKIAAAVGYTDAMIELGDMNIFGHIEEAAKWYELARAQGDPKFMLMLGQSEMGRHYSLSLNGAEAVKWYKLAAAQGHVPSQLALGFIYGWGNFIYTKGSHVVQDYAESVKWYKLAAAQGDSTAQAQLGDSYNKGVGVVRNVAEAVKWYELAAVQGDSSAQFNLGVMYHEGQGVVQDYSRAHLWFNLAAAGGYIKAVEKRDEVATKMTSQQISEAQKLARECQASHFKHCD